MTVIKITSPNGTLANIVHYGAHPTVLGSSSRLISHDWPGIMIDPVEKFTKAPTLFINGALGDVAPLFSTKQPLATASMRCEKWAVLQRRTRCEPGAQSRSTATSRSI